jgi:hypothetical protein
MNAGAFPFEAHPNPVDPDERAARLVDPAFGRVFTDHMVTIRYSDDKGWHDAKVGPRGPLTLDPATAVLHYAQEIFEGLKAYRHADGTIWTFRPDANGRRLQSSAARMALPELPVEYFLDKPQFKRLVADTLNETAVKKRGYFEPKRVAALIDNMNRTREFVFCKQVVSLVILELWHQVFIDKAHRFE